MLSESISTSLARIRLSLGGPPSAVARSSGCLAALPFRLALFEEGVHALHEILAHVGLEDQVLVALRAARVEDPAHRLLERLDRQRRVPGDCLGQLLDALLEA